MLVVTFSILGKWLPVQLGFSVNLRGFAGDENLLAAVEAVGATRFWAAPARLLPLPSPLLSAHMGFSHAMISGPGVREGRSGDPVPPGWVVTFGAGGVGSEHCFGLWSFWVVAKGAGPGEPRAVHGAQRWDGFRAWWVPAEAPGFGSRLVSVIQLSSGFPGRRGVAAGGRVKRRPGSRTEPINWRRRRAERIHRNTGLPQLGSSGGCTAWGESTSPRRSPRLLVAGRVPQLFGHWLRLWLPRCFPGFSSPNCGRGGMWQSTAPGIGGGAVGFFTAFWRCYASGIWWAHRMEPRDPMRG